MPKERSHGEGAVKVVCIKCRRALVNGKCPKCGRRDPLYVGVVDLGRGPDGKRRQKYIYKRNKKELIEALQTAIAEAQAGSLPPSERITVGQYLSKWLEQAARKTVRPSTFTSYSRMIRLHTAPIASVPLVKLTPLHLQQLYHDLEASGLSARSIQYLHAILHRALKQAVKWQYVPRNVADAVDPPRPARREMQALSQEQVRRFLAVAQQDRLYPLFALAIATGMRQGELLGLRWSDVDLRRGRLHIVQTLQWINGQPVIQEPKTNRSRRIVTIPASVVSILTKWRKDQAAERLAQGIGGQPDLVFTRPDGQPIRADWLTKHFQALLATAGLPKIRFHDLRHTHATMLLSEGVHPKVVSDRLGHSTVTLTLDTYSHVLPDIQREVAERLERIIRPGEQGETTAN